MLSRSIEADHAWDTSWASPLALFVWGAASLLAMDRDRFFYPTVLIVVATYYVLFAMMDGSHRVLLSEIAIAAVFTVVAVVGFNRNLW